MTRGRGRLRKSLVAGLLAIVVAAPAAASWDGLLAVGRDWLHLSGGWELLVPLTVDAAAAYCAALALRAVLARDSAVIERALVWVYAAASAGLQVWHAESPQQAVILAGASVSAAVLWDRTLRAYRRDALREVGAIEPPLPRFRALRWVVAPAETARAWRVAIVRGLTSPAEALELARCGFEPAALRSSAPQVSPPRAVVPDPDLGPTWVWSDDEAREELCDRVEELVVDGAREIVLGDLGRFVGEVRPRGWVLRELATGLDGRVQPAGRAGTYWVTAIQGPPEAPSAQPEPADDGPVDLWPVDTRPLRLPVFVAPEDVTREMVDGEPADEPHPEVEAAIRAELAAASTKRDALMVAWRRLGVHGVPETGDVSPAVRWLAEHGVTCDLSGAYATRRAMSERSIAVPARAELLTTGGAP